MGKNCINSEGINDIIKVTMVYYLIQIHTRFGPKEQKISTKSDFGNSAMI